MNTLKILFITESFKRTSFKYGDQKLRAGNKRLIDEFQDYFSMNFYSLIKQILFLIYTSLHSKRFQSFYFSQNWQISTLFWLITVNQLSLEFSSWELYLVLISPNPLFPSIFPAEFPFVSFFAPLSFLFEFYEFRREMNPTDFQILAVW